MAKKTTGAKPKTPKPRATKKSSETLKAELAVLNEAIKAIGAACATLRKKRVVVEAKIAKEIAPKGETPSKPKRALQQMHDDAQEKNSRRTERY